MASDPIPEPLINQDVDDNQQPEFAHSRRQPQISEVPIRADRELPEAHPRLRRAAQAVGSTLGEAVHLAREASQRTAATAEETKQGTQGKIISIKERASDAVDGVRDSTARAYEDAKAKVESTYFRARQRAIGLLENAQQRSRYLAHEYPLQVIGAVAGAAFLAGMLLRIWRSGRDQ
jgi:hypothetical protein